ncbi:MAG: type IV pilus twitching motility protein PilT [Candidatus Dojkabacteria bacterium]|nr:type IV pilus twitching motility protein PilT [Candidatus Dojkabacteria bacterium]
MQDANGNYNINDLLGVAVSKNASDLHISVGYPPIIRVDGELQEISEKPLTPEDTESLIFSVLADEKKELLEVNREIDFAYTYEGGNNARFRVNAFYTMKNLSAAFRLIPSRIKTIEELMLPQMYHQFAKLKQGLILVTGPTGHGKSTTLAAILEDINRTRFCHIVTIEDPIEYLFEGKKALIDQREMNDDTHSWEIALRSALRQDPDVILVGEMRDYETIAAAITLAETGHLVFATLHTNSASQTIDRIIDVFPENQQQQVRTQLANILQAVVGQRLIPLEKGGRRAVSEIMIMNPAVSNLIREAKTHQIDNVIRTSSDIGMVSLEKALVNLVREGLITTQKAQEYAVYPEEVLRLMKV